LLTHRHKNHLHSQYLIINVAITIIVTIIIIITITIITITMFAPKVGTRYFFLSPLPLVRYLEIMLPLCASPQFSKIC
jgi:hypothetical protein